jgi:hypothetical protein
MCSCVVIQDERLKCTRGQNAVYGGNVKLITRIEIYKVSIRVYFGCEDHITQPPTVTVGQVVTEGNVPVYQ